MNTLAICNEWEEENRVLKEVSKEKIALISEEKWRLSEYKRVEEFQEYIKDENFLEVSYINVTKDNGQKAAKSVRKKYKYSSMVVIADEKISPMKYLVPDIQPQALLMRPFHQEEARKVLGEVYKYLQDEQESEQEVFVMEERNQERKIPLNRIAYFEARNKKLYVTVENEEYGFYGTLEKLAERLPAYFIRCHRSYLVNGKKIQRIFSKRGELELEHEMVLPLSRTYRKRIKDYYEKGLSEK